MARKSDRFTAIEKDDMLPVCTTEKTEIKVALYARISVDRNDKAESLESQIAILEEFISKHPEMNMIKTYVDCGKSGTDFNRPEFQQMMTDAKARIIDCIIVKDLSRLGRNQLEISNLIYTIFPFLKIRFISVNDHFDTNEAENDNKSMEIAIKNLVNEMYAKDISKKIAVARHQSMKKGSFTGSYAPYGYQIEAVDGIRKMVPDPATSEIVRKIFHWAAEGVALRDIALNLNKMKVTIPGQYQKTKHLYLEEGDEEKKWYVGTLSNILHNPAYIGNVVQNKSSKKLYANIPEKQNSEDEYIVLEDFHEAIISKEIFEKIKKNNKEKIASSRFSSNRGKDIKVQENKYNGILFCGVCGKRVPQISELVNKTNEKTGKTSLKRKYYFTCNGRYSLEGHHASGIRIVESLLDEIVMRTLQAHVDAYLKDKRPVLQVIEKAGKQRRKGFERKLSKHQSKIGELDYQETEIYGEYVLKTISSDVYEVKQQEMQLMRNDLLEQISILESQITEMDKNEMLLRRWTKAFLKCQKAQKVTKALLDQMVERIELHPDKELKITFKFQQDLKGMMKAEKKVI